MCEKQKFNNFSFNRIGEATLFNDISELDHKLRLAFELAGVNGTQCIPKMILVVGGFEIFFKLIQNLVWIILVSWSSPIEI